MQDALKEEKMSSGVEELSCEGAAEKDECLKRRTLAAHVDYIYTQNVNP